MGMTAFVFPGQGSQYVGMAKDIFEADPASRALMEKADAILGIPLSRLCFNGPEEELRQTRNTQPAIFLHSVVLFAATLAQNAASSNVADNPAPDPLGDPMVVLA